MGADFPEDLIPDDPDEITPEHYRLIGEWVYRNDSTPADREMFRELFVKHGSWLADDVDTGDLDDVAILWRGWELAANSIGQHLLSDCGDEDVTEHMMMHFGRAMRFSAIILMGVTGDLIPHPDDA